MDYPTPSLDEPPKYGDRHYTRVSINRVEPLPPPYSIVYIQSQPIVIVQEEPRLRIKPKSKSTNSPSVEAADNPRKHLCMCERGCERCMNCVCCMPDRYSTHNCPTKCSDISSFRVKHSSDDNGIFCGVICFPVTVLIKLIQQVPCVTYNICRNLCKGTNSLDYIP